MAGASIKAEWDGEDLAGIRRVLDEMLAQTDDLTPLFQDVGEYLLPATQDRAALGVDPDGVPFEPLSEAYRRRKGSDRILFLNNILIPELAYQADAFGLQLGTNAAYGATHQFGRDAIPARPFLGFSQDDIAEIEAIARDFLDELLTP